MTWQVSFKHYNVQIIRQPHWEMTIKHPAWKKTWSVAADIQTEHGHSSRRKTGLKIGQEVESAKFLLFSV